MKKNERLFDINEPIPERLPCSKLRSDEFPNKLLTFCANTSLKNVVIEVLRQKPDSYQITRDRGPGAIDAPLAKRNPRDLDPVETLRINDHYTPPVLGFPCTTIGERTTFTAQWTLRYQKACGMPEGERAAALADFSEAFHQEVALAASYVVRKAALADVSAADGSPVGSMYASSHPFWQFAPRCRLGELGPQPTLPGSSISAQGDACLDASPRAAVYVFNGIRYEIVNHRHNVALCGSHENACRLGGHRLRGASHITLADEAFVHQAPTAVVEYCGYRVLASGVLPVAPRASTAYGSQLNAHEESDNYSRVDDQAVSAMRNVATTLNLKGHWCGAGLARQFLYSNGDLFVQRGVDNRLYVVSGEERLFPPCTTNNRSFPNGYLYRRLRPELVKHSKKSKTVRMPLSSDAFSNFGIVRAEEHDREVALITEVLKQQIVNDATNRILQTLAGVATVSDGIRRLAEEGGVVALLHRSGVNARFLGEISTRLSGRYFRLRAQQVSADSPEMIVPISILLSVLRMEMIARAMKVLIRRLLRNRSVARVANFVSGALRYQATASVLVTEKAPDAPLSDVEKDKGKKRLKATIVEDSPKGNVDKNDEGDVDSAEDEGTDTFQAEEDYFNCFDRSVWPIIEAKFGAGEGVTIVRFTPNQICVNAQVPYRHVDAVAAVLQSIMDATGITFAKKKAKWQSEGSEEPLDAGGVADEIVNGVARPGEAAEISAGEPLAVVTMQATPPLCYRSGESLHLIGVARSTVRNASLAVELKYLHPNHKRNQLFLSVVDYCAVYCLDSNLVEDQDVVRWMRFRKDMVRRIMTRREAILRRRENDGNNGVVEGYAAAQQDAAQYDDGHEHSVPTADAAEKRMETFYVEPDVVAYPLSSRSTAAKDYVLLNISSEKLHSQFGVAHRDILRLRRRNSDAFESCVVIGMNKYLYVTDYLEPPSADTPEDDASLPYQLARAILVMDQESLSEDYEMEVCGPNGFVRYYDPVEMGIHRTTKEVKKPRTSLFGDDNFISSDEEVEERRRLIGTDNRSDVCYFFGTSWSVVEYITSPNVLDTFIANIRSGHRIILTSTGATFRVIGVRFKQLWVCQERVDALPRVLQPTEFGSMAILHLMDRVSYDEHVLRFHNRSFQRSLSTLNKFTLFYGQKILLRSGPLAGVVGIVLGSETDVVHVLNVTSKEVMPIPGRTREEIFESMSPLLVGCVLDLSVFEPIEPTSFSCTTTDGTTVVLDIRAEKLLLQFGVVQGSLVEVLLGPFALQRCRALGSAGDRLWVTLPLVPGAADRTGLGMNALPLKDGEYRVMSDAPIAVRTNPNRRLALTAEDRDKHSDEMRLTEPLDPFEFLCATGIPMVFDRHSDVCGVFNLFHGQVILVAKDVFAKWEPMTVLGVFQGELWVVPDGLAAAVPLDGFSGTELLQIYSIIEVRGHTEVHTFYDYLHLEGFEIVPFTIRSKVTRESTMIHVLDENGELIGLDKSDSALRAVDPPLAVRFGDCVEELVPDNSSQLLISSASAIWKRRKVYKHYTVVGTYNGAVYAVAEGCVGCSVLVLVADTMRVTGSKDVIPLSMSTLEHMQRELRLRKRKSSDSDMEHRKSALLDALHLVDTPALPPPGLPQVSNDDLAQRYVPQVLDFALHNFCERFAEAHIPESQCRLVLHWMLTWFGASLRFADTKRDGLLKLCAIEACVLKKPLPLPTMLDYDAFRVRREAQRRQAEQALSFPAQQLVEWKNEAFTYCLPRTKDAQDVNRQLRLMPTLEEHVGRGDVLPAAALPFSETQRQLATKDLLAMQPQTAPDKEALCKSSRALLDMQRRRKSMQATATAADSASLAVQPEGTQAERMNDIITGAWAAGLQQIRRSLEAQIASAMVETPSTDGATKNGARRGPQDASKIHRYKTSEGGLIFLDSSDTVCHDVFQMVRGEVYRYTSGDMAGVHVVVLGVWEGALWRYEERMSSRDAVTDEQARPFLGRDGDEIRRQHPLALVDHREPRTCDPFYFPRLEGALVKFDMEESSCSPFSVFHGQRFVVRKEPYALPPLPKCRHGAVVTAIGVYGQNMFFASEGSGAFSINSNDPVRDLGLEPLYSTVVGAFAVERKNWTRCPVEIVRRGKSYVVSVCFDTTPELLHLWHPSIRMGTVVRIPTSAEDIAAWKHRYVLMHSRKKSRVDIAAVTADPAPDSSLAQIIGCRGNVLYRALLHEDLARPLTDAERTSMHILGREELRAPYDGGPLQLFPSPSVAARAEKHLSELFEYVDTSGSDSGLMLRPPTKFKAFNTFQELCLYDQTEDELRVFGVHAFDWVKIFVAQSWRWAIIVGVRNGCLFRLDEEHLGVLACELRLVPIRTDDEAVELAETFHSQRPPAASSPPVTSLFNHCTNHKGLIRNYSLVVLGTAKIRGFVG